jgi:hypothetical protein
MLALTTTTIGKKIVMASRSLSRRKPKDYRPAFYALARYVASKEANGSRDSTHYLERDELTRLRRLPRSGAYVFVSQRGDPSLIWACVHSEHGEVMSPEAV